MPPTVKEPAVSATAVEAVVTVDTLAVTVVIGLPASVTDA